MNRTTNWKPARSGVMPVGNGVSGRWHEKIPSKTRRRVTGVGLILVSARQCVRRRVVNTTQRRHGVHESRGRGGMRAAIAMGMRQQHRGRRPSPVPPTAANGGRKYDLI